ncbi:hypothetical protein D8S78_23245 [Natrialba swarupiae]|nr:hypothetical protein [Natrialba swarupiae]
MSLVLVYVVLEVTLPALEPGLIRTDSSHGTSLYTRPGSSARGPESGPFAGRCPQAVCYSFRCYDTAVSGHT